MHFTMLEASKYISWPWYVCVTSNSHHPIGPVNNGAEYVPREAQ